MAWNIIREATKEDYERLNATAWRFAARHGIRIENAAVYDVKTATIKQHQNRASVRERSLRPLWRACVHRALRDQQAESIHYGNVGYYVEDGP